MPSSTSRAAIPYPLSTDPVNVPSDMENLANRIDAIYGPESHGTFASIPAFGNFGFKYFATDVAGQDGGLGQWFFDTGTRWCAINPPVPFVKLDGSTPITGSQTFNANITVDGNATVDGTLTVAGVLTATGGIPAYLKGAFSGTPLVGSYSGQQLLQQGSLKSSPTGAGTVTITFDAAFPNGVMYVTALGPSGSILYVFTVASCTKTAVVLNGLAWNGTEWLAFGAGSNLAMTWSAVGF